MGKFNNKIEAEFDPPRKWILSRALIYTNPYIDEDALERVGVEIKGSKITVKKDFVTDLASVPRMCWAFIAPWDVARAAIIHDLLYKRIRQYRAECSKCLKNSEDPKVISEAKKASDDVFHMAMKDAEPSVAGWKIAAAYYSVRMFGRWSIIPREDDQMTHCRNCGYESHCGVEYKREERNGRGKFLGEIVVCKYCRCELCDDRNEPWPGPGVQERKNGRLY